MELIGRVIAELREARDWSRTEFAGMIGRSPSWLTKIENGQRSIRDLDDLRTIAAALGMDESDLLAVAGQDLDTCALLPDAVRALSIAAETAAARAHLDPAQPGRSLAELAEGLAQAKSHMNDARPVDAAGVLAETIVELERAAVADDGGWAKANSATAVLIEAYQVAALVLSHTGDHDTARVIAHAATFKARWTGRPTLPPALTATCVHRRANSLILATALAEIVLDAVSRTTAEGSTECAIRGAVRLELAALAAHSRDRTNAAVHLSAAEDDARFFSMDIQLPGGIWFGPAMLAIRQLDVAIRTDDPRLALAISARLDTTGLPIMAQARARIYTAAAHGLAGNNRKAARIVAETVCMAPQLTKDPVVQRLLKTFYQPHSVPHRRRSPATS